MSSELASRVLDELDRRLQRAREELKRQPCENRAWLAGYTEALERVYGAVESEAFDLGVLSTTWPS